MNLSAEAPGSVWPTAQQLKFFQHLVVGLFHDRGWEEDTPYITAYTEFLTPPELEETPFCAIEVMLRI